ncbi:Bifunctional dehydrogenase and ferrochelatase [Pestalotiopsis sp. IQ-011]
MSQPGSPGEKADAQSKSSFFGLPREIWDMVYVQCWEVSGPRQHVFQREAGGGRRADALRVRVVSGGRAARYQERGVREVLAAREAGGRPRGVARVGEAHVVGVERALVLRGGHARGGRGPERGYENKTERSVFLPTRLRSIELSLNVPYAALHNLSGPISPSKPPPRQDGNANSFIRKPSNPRPNDWEDVCAALSDICEHHATLRDVAIRLDLAEDDRYWWEYRASSPGDDHADERQKKSKEGGPAQEPDEPFLVHPLPSYLRSSPRGCESRRLDPDFKSLERYSRRRWTSPRGADDRLEPRLEFFTPRWQAMAGPDVVISKLDGLFRGMLMS